MNSACAVGKGYVWNSTNAHMWLRHLLSDRASSALSAPLFWGFELGNEVNNRGTGGYPISDCKERLDPLSQAAAFNQLHAMLEDVYPAGSAPVLVGPDTGYLRPENWTRPLLEAWSAAARRPLPLFALTHHVYPGITLANFDNPKTLDRAQHDIAWYVPMARELVPSAQIWAGE